MSSRIFIHEIYLGESRAEPPPRERMHFRQDVERCFLEFRDQVFRYLRALGCEHSTAEEMTQEAFLRLYRALQSGSRVNDRRAWVFRVARNLYIDQRRDHQRYLTACQEEPALRDRTPSDAAPDPEQQALRRERVRLIEEEVLRLPELQRECMHLRAQGLRYREIATALDITLSAAVECVRSAVKKLGGIASE
ncbi:MAG: RNA polymerase sigma factor [Acidobacteriia bacterium]|nr:RNA polymerase sigma factor [Terriglobia bacterium]